MDIDLIRHILAVNNKTITGHGLANAYLADSLHKDMHWQLESEPNTIFIDIVSTLQISDDYTRNIKTRLLIRAMQVDLLPVWELLEQLQSANDTGDYYNEMVSDAPFWRLGIDIIAPDEDQPRTKPFIMSKNREFLKFVAKACTPIPYDSKSHISWTTMDIHDGTLYGYTKRQPVPLFDGTLTGWHISPPREP